MQVGRRCHCAPDLISELQRAGVPLRGLLGITHNTDVSVLVPNSRSRSLGGKSHPCMASIVRANIYVEAGIRLSEVHSASLWTKLHSSSAAIHSALRANVAAKSPRRMWSGA
eukprot:3046361-Prorocentrum_lima.AAC.1